MPTTSGTDRPSRWTYSMVYATEITTKVKATWSAAPYCVISLQNQPGHGRGETPIELLSHYGYWCILKRTSFIDATEGDLLSSHAKECAYRIDIVKLCDIHHVLHALLRHNTV